MGGIKWRDALAALLIALVVSVAAIAPVFDTLRYFSIDVLTWLRWTTVGRVHDAAQSSAVVIALDEETYATHPFAGTPQATWVNEIGRVVAAVTEGGAAVVGFDIIFPASIERSRITFRDPQTQTEATIGDKLRGFEREYLLTLRSMAQAGKLVLGQVQHTEHPIQPEDRQRMSVGQQRNIRALNAYNDPDDIIRRLPLTFATGDEHVPSMAVELAARLQKATPELAADGAMTLAGYRVPSRVPNTIALNFEGGSGDIPTFSLADLRACVEKGDAEYFRKHFAGRAVLIGTVLDVEDRKLTSKRLATGIEGATAPRCALTAPASSSKYVRDSISGVYMHATAINNLVRHDALTEAGRGASFAVNFGFAAFAGAAALTLNPVLAVLALIGVSLAWVGLSTWAFVYALVMPLIDPVLAGFVVLAAVTGYRFVVSDKDKRLLRKSFALYLSPAVIEKMMASSKPPELGGESRNITVYFSDVAGFSSFSEKMTPTELVTLMNEYLSAMTEVIEAHGGFVDKYIGDAIVAVFGAPVQDPHHALHAVQAALKCQVALTELNRTAVAFKGYTLGQRIGLNSGEALVGNIGSRRRFNYTVMGDVVNLASRLEGANKYFGSGIMASETTAEQAGPSIAWRALDAIRVKGRAAPVEILEPLGATGTETPEQKRIAAAYAQGLLCWRRRDFAGAVESFAKVAAIDPPSALFLDRAKKFVAVPPPADWEPVNTLEGK